jgi:glycerate dehydrogenase
MTRIVVLDGYTLNPGDNPWGPLEAIGELTVYDRSPDDLIVERAEPADIVLTNKTELGRAVLERLPNLRGIGVLATGFNVVDVVAARELGIPVCNVPAYSTASAAQHTVALLLELTNAVGVHDHAVHQGEWAAAPDFTFWKRAAVELDGQVLGIVGYGAIGQRVAAIAASLGMLVIAAARAGVTARSTEEGVERRTLEQLFREADVVSLHCPLTPATERLVRRERLLTMKPSALLVNTARGGLVDEVDLANALDHGVISGAALDVLSSEPPGAVNPLLRAKNCIITPHIAWTSLAARRRLLEVTAENVRALLAGRPINVVNRS